LVKGWLFYPADRLPAMDGISPAHCRGFWCALQEVGQLAAAQFVILPRLQWLAPYRGSDPALDRAQLQGVLGAQFETVPMPVLVASVQEEQGMLVETGRGFIVPDNWRARAAFRQKLAQPGAGGD
jgi:uncharacterized protein